VDGRTRRGVAEADGQGGDFVGSGHCVITGTPGGPGTTKRPTRICFFWEKAWMSMVTMVATSMAIATSCLSGFRPVDQPVRRQSGID
jgi:hypothetical protein